MSTHRNMQHLSNAIEKLRRASNMGSGCKLDTDEATVVVKVLNNAINMIKEYSNAALEKKEDKPVSREKAKLKSKNSRGK